MSDAGKAASQLAEEVRNQQAQVQGALREQQAAAAALQQELNVALQRGGELQSQLAAADGKVGGQLLLPLLLSESTLPWTGMHVPLACVLSAAISAGPCLPPLAQPAICWCPPPLDLLLSILSSRRLLTWRCSCRRWPRSASVCWSAPLSLRPRWVLALLAGCCAMHAAACSTCFVEQTSLAWRQSNSPGPPPGTLCPALLCAMCLVLPAS